MFKAGGGTIIAYKNGIFPSHEMSPIHVIPWKTLPSHQLLSPGESGDQTLGLWWWSLLWHNSHSICCKKQAGIISNELHNNYEWHVINELQCRADTPSACGTSAEVVAWSLSLNILSEVLCAPPHQPTASARLGCFSWGCANITELFGLKNWGIFGLTHLSGPHVRGQTLSASKNLQ